jgi:ubiquinone/menaquinone biosynthesis C-methylase UbiE
MPAKPAYSKIAQAQCERTAREYFAFRKRGNTANDLVETPAMRKLIGNVHGKRLIDCGCGFGSYSLYCAKQGATVTAIDISKTMIDLARREAAEAGVQIEFKVRDVADMNDIPSNTFDIAISSIAVCFDMPLFLKEIARVLKLNAALCFSEVHPILNTISESYFTKGIRNAQNVFGKLHPSDPDYEWQWEQYTLEDYFSGLREAGFSVETFLEPKPDPAMKHLNPDLYALASKRPACGRLPSCNLVSRLSRWLCLQ